MALAGTEHWSIMNDDRHLTQISTKTGKYHGMRISFLKIASHSLQVDSKSVIPELETFIHVPLL